MHASRSHKGKWEGVVAFAIPRVEGHFLSLVFLRIMSSPTIQYCA